MSGPLFSFLFFSLIFVPFFVGSSKQGSSHIHVFIQNTSTHLNKWQYKHAEVIYRSAGRQTQLHTSHLHNSNSLYVNKVPLDFLCSPKPLHPSCSISPRVLCSLPAQTERCARTHARTRTFARCTCQDQEQQGSLSECVPLLGMSI